MHRGVPLQRMGRRQCYRQCRETTEESTTPGRADDAGHLVRSDGSVVSQQMSVEQSSVVSASVVSGQCVRGFVRAPVGTMTRFRPTPANVRYAELSTSGGLAARAFVRCCDAWAGSD